MTIQSWNEVSRKAPKLARLALSRETLQELTEREAEAAGGQVYRPRPVSFGPYCYRSNALPCGWSWDPGCTAKCATSI